ncbi:hypothetical protein I203_101962 [Kwoniella mangroviensis CBS 8507]|uniref:uncharacterized protein n=1 Tax=Kwoniella mangroviensis CBS 8507 TaxID=1296122 RepID=UPI003036F909
MTYGALFRLPAVSLRPSLQHLAASSSCRSRLRYASTTSQAAEKIDSRKAFSHTLLLPKTNFPLKHKDVVEAEKKYRLKTSDLLYKEQINRKDNPLFVLHDGPPYANGNLHMGHALNKVLKDIINRYNLIRGKRVHYVPGWDCHGLPIEHKALAAIGKSHTALNPTQVRSEARKVALDAIDVQKSEMKALGVMADWDGENGTYRTLAETVQDYGRKRLRPTYYSPSSRTALAEAELSYKDGHKSRSVYVGFPVAEEDMSEGLAEVYRRECGGKGKLELAIWTTTPWTLPANMSSTDRILVIGVDRLEPMEEILGRLDIIGCLPGKFSNVDMKLILIGSKLVGTRYTHLFHPPSLSQPKPLIFAAGHVTSQAGTGLVHSAPAHGHEDYEAFIAVGMLPEELRCPVDDDGRFTSDLESWVEGVIASSLVGKEVLGKGSDAMVDLLSRSDVLLAEQKIEHRYPYDWKSKKPIIVRATPQWFADVEGVKSSAVEAMDRVHFHPAISRKRLEAFITSRSEWCISRQRSWGVPIPALFGPDGPIMDSTTLDHIIGVLDKKGVDHWWEGKDEDFVPPHLQGQNITRSFDTLDVWFDSGSSWTLLEGLSRQPLADVYLEGSDQHRGWFQSSMLTKLISSTEKIPPYGTVITHGFVMDEQGDKMSKSAGNGLSPMEIIHGKKIDRYILHEMSHLESVAQEAYDSHIFNRVLHSATTFATSTLSAFYFDIIKDTMYCDDLESPTRKAIVLGRMTSLLAPITPHLAEEIYENIGGKEASVFLEPWIPDLSWLNPTVKSKMSQIISLRAEVQKLVENARAEKRIKVGNQTEVYLSKILGTGNIGTLSAMLGVSSVGDLSSADKRAMAWTYESSLEVENETISLLLGPATRSQCPRCWLYNAEKENSLCSRCEEVINVT